MKGILFILLLLFSGCAITYDTTHKCELMLRGEPCLSDHACCKSTIYHYETYPNYYNWWWATRPTHTNYVIIKPNKPIWNNNRPNKPNTNKPNRKNKKR